MSATINLFARVIRGNAIQIAAIFQDFDQTTLIDPDSNSLTFFDPTGTQIGAAVINPTEDSIGHWHYYFTPPANAVLGTWTCYWQILKGGIPSGENYLFEVAAKKRP